VDGIDIDTICNDGGDMDITRRNFTDGPGALAGKAVASQFDRQLKMLSQVLSGPQEWVLSFNEVGLELLCKNRCSSGITDKGTSKAHLEFTLDISEGDVWTLATLTDPDGDEWRTVDGKTWTCGKLAFRLCEGCGEKKTCWDTNKDVCMDCSLEEVDHFPDSVEIVEQIGE